MAINGKKKGNKNERNLCKWWQSWSGLEFNRIPASGGLRWNNTQNITGDIICTDERHSRRFPFSIEAKSYKDIRFEHLILGNKGVKVMEFWNQTKEDGIRGNKIPILFMRYNNMPSSVWFTIIPLNVYKLFKLKLGVTKYPVIQIKTEDEEIILMNSEDLKNVDYKEFIIAIKKLRKNEK